MWPQWLALTVVATWFLCRLVANLDNRPSPNGTDAEQRARSAP